MAKALFVCYQHGCKGEFLSHKISTHKFFRTLSKQSVNNRTILKGLNLILENSLIKYMGFFANSAYPIILFLI